MTQLSGFDALGLSVDVIVEAHGCYLLAPAIRCKPAQMRITLNGTGKPLCSVKRIAVAHC